MSLFVVLPHWKVDFDLLIRRICTDYWHRPADKVIFLFVGLDFTERILKCGDPEKKIEPSAENVQNYGILKAYI